MMTKVTHLTVFVKDQDAALDFYTNKLGFAVHTDADFGGMRWVTVCPKDQRDFEIVLSKATTPEQEALVGKQTPNQPLFCVQSEDCASTVAELKKNGVMIVAEPQKQAWGTSALALDLNGNGIYIVSQK